MLSSYLLVLLEGRSESNTFWSYFDFM